MRVTDGNFAQVEECVRFDIFKAVIIKIIVFWDVTPYSLVDVYQNISTHYQTTYYHIVEGRNLQGTCS
jgi:hypothetical protein